MSIKSMTLVIRKYIRIYLLFIKNCIVAEMEYRANFFMGIAVECSWLVSKIIYAVVFYQTGVTISGMSPDAMLMFVGMHTIMTGILISFFWPNFGRLTEYVRNGSLDLYLTKPISLQFITTLRYFSFGTLLPNVAGGLVMLVIGASRVDVTFHFYHLLAFIAFVLLGTVLSYALFLLPNLLTFKVVDMGPVNMIMSQMQEMNNVPMIVYSKWVQMAGLYLFPLFAISNIFPMFLLRQSDTAMLVTTLVSPFVLIVVIRLIWSQALKAYASASS